MKKSIEYSVQVSTYYKTGMAVGLRTLTAKTMTELRQKKDEFLKMEKDECEVIKFHGHKKIITLLHIDDQVTHQFVEETTNEYL